MNKNFLIALFLVFSSNIFAYDLPTIAVLNLIYTKTEKTPITTTTTDTSGLLSSSSTTTTTVLKQEVQRQLPIFNADVKGAIINSRQFKVVDMPSANNLWKGNTETILAYLSGLNKIKNSNNLAPATPTVADTPTKLTQKESNPTNKPTESPVANSTNKPSNSNLPDYILTGVISSITQDEDVEPIENTNKTTAQYNIDISVDYQIVGTKDNAVIASFNGYGHANDVKILNNGDTIQKQHHNIPLLINQASKSLAQNVVDQLKQQFSVSSKTYKLESITDLKVYN